MEKLKMPSIPRSSALQVSRPMRAVAPYRMNDPLPKISNHSTDVEIPRAVWSSWKEDGKPKQLRRALMPSERQLLEERAVELMPMIIPLQPDQAANVKACITDMFRSFRSMRQTGVEAMALVEGTFLAVSDQPAWAVEKACFGIMRNGVWRGGAFDRQWPPNDSEIIAAVRTEVRLYGDTHRMVVSLLEAEVES